MSYREWADISNLPSYKRSYPEPVCDYTKEEAYRYVGSDRFQWTWEFLRRKESYQRLYDRQQEMLQTGTYTEEEIWQHATGYIHRNFYLNDPLDWRSPDFGDNRSDYSDVHTCAGPWALGWPVESKNSVGTNAQKTHIVGSNYSKVVSNLLVCASKSTDMAGDSLAVFAFDLSGDLDRQLAKAKAMMKKIAQNFQSIELLLYLVMMV